MKKLSIQQSLFMSSTMGYLIGALSELEKGKATKAQVLSITRLVFISVVNFIVNPKDENNVPVLPIMTGDVEYDLEYQNINDPNPGNHRIVLIDSDGTVYSIEKLCSNKEILRINRQILEELYKLHAKIMGIRNDFLDQLIIE